MEDYCLEDKDRGEEGIEARISFENVMIGMEALILKSQSMFPTLRSGDTLLLNNYNVSEIEPFDR